jgi:hypothetical protein
MIDLNKIFGTFEDYETVIERCNPSHLSIANFSYDREPYEAWEKELFFGRNQYLRYILIKLVEKRLRRNQIFESQDPKTAVIGKDWERASYIVRFSFEYTHLGIAGAAMKELTDKVSGVKLRLQQSGHGEPAIIAKIDKIYDYATVVGAGFVKIDTGEKQVTLFGRSRSFTVSYDHQIKYYLGMTSHEFVAKILKAELPKGWEAVTANNKLEVEITDEREVIPKM